MPLFVDTKYLSILNPVDFENNADKIEAMS